MWCATKRRRCVTYSRLPSVDVTDFSRRVARGALSASCTSTVIECRSTVREREAPMTTLAEACFVRSERAVRHPQGWTPGCTAYGGLDRGAGRRGGAADRWGVPFLPLRAAQFAFTAPATETCRAGPAGRGRAGSVTRVSRWNRSAGRRLRAITLTSCRSAEFGARPPSRDRTFWAPGGLSEVWTLRRRCSRPSLPTSNAGWPPVPSRSPMSKSPS